MSARTLNPPTHKSKREAGAAFGAGLFIYRFADEEGITLSNKPPWLTG
jgi:hypothetical protein